MRRTMTMAAVAAAMLVGGCGGESNGDEGYSDFTAATNAACRDEPAVPETFDALTGDPAKDAAALDEFVPELKTYVEDIQDIEPPEELVEQVQIRNVALNETYGYFEDLQKLADAGDTQAYQSFLSDKAKQQELSQIGEAGAAASSKLGAADCL